VPRPKKQKVRFRIGLNSKAKPLLLNPVPFTYEEFTMKRILVALVLFVGIATVVGCGGGSSTSAPKSSGK